MIKSMDPTVDKCLVQNLKCRGWCWITCEQKCNNDDDDDDGGDGDDGGDDFCLETFGIDEGWSAERSCFGKTSSFESPLRGLSVSDDDDANANEDTDEYDFWRVLSSSASSSSWRE